MKKMSTSFLEHDKIFYKSSIFYGQGHLSVFLYALNTKVCALVSHQPNESVVHNIFFWLSFVLLYQTKCCLWWDGTTEVGPFETLNVWYCIFVVYLSCYHYDHDHAFI